MAFKPRTYQLEREVPLSRDRVWQLVANTDHMNRVIGLFAVKAGGAVRSDGGYCRTLVARVAGPVSLRWSEFPFQWSRGRYYSVVRKYLGGPMERFYGGVRLRDGAEAGRSTLIELFAEFTPRNLVGLLAIPLVGRGSMVKTMKYVSDYLKLNRGFAERLLPSPKASYRVNDGVADRLLGELAASPVAIEATERFRDHIARSGDDEVIDMKPFVLADRWGLDREEVLRWFLYATKAGVTNLSWHLICPNCRVAKVDAPTLGKTPERFHCDFCAIDYTASFDRSVELTFSVHPDIRKAVKQVYCVGGPQITPHIYVQAIAERGRATVVEVPSEVSAYRMRALQANRIVEVRKDGRRPAAEIVYGEDGWGRPAVELDASASEILVRNESSRDIVIACERSDWGRDAVTAAMVTTMEEFRRMFSSEVLSPGQQIGVESVTLMFTDLLGSTSFYETAGDARAYGEVRRHFGFLTEWIARNHGSVVKTIGDAVMAVFPTPTDGLAAALAIQSHVDEFNAGLADGIVIKIGLHHGPAIAVNSNDRLDYFGRTVNIAARIQALSDGGDIVLSARMGAGDEIPGMLANLDARIETFEAVLKGIEGPEPLVRLSPGPAGWNLRGSRPAESRLPPSPT